MLFSNFDLVSLLSNFLSFASASSNSEEAVQCQNQQPSSTRSFKSEDGEMNIQRSSSAPSLSSDALLTPVARFAFFLFKPTQPFKPCRAFVILREDLTLLFASSTASALPRSHKKELSQLTR